MADQEASDPAPGVHSAVACAACHDSGTYVLDAAIDNTKCQSCHDQAAPLAAGGGADKKVDRHFSDTYNDPTTGVINRYYVC